MRCNRLKPNYKENINGTNGTDNWIDGGAMVALSPIIFAGCYNFLAEGRGNKI